MVQTFSHQVWSHFLPKIRIYFEQCDYCVHSFLINMALLSRFTFYDLQRRVHFPNGTELNFMTFTCKLLTTLINRSSSKHPHNLLDTNIHILD